MPAGTALTRNDTAWSRMDTDTNLMVVAGFFRFSAPVDIDEVKRALDGGLLRLDRFRQRVVDPGGLRLPRWVDDPDFDVDHHVVEDRLPEPGDDGALRAAIESHLSRPLDRNRPLWEMRVYQGLGSGSALFFRVHHCIADGIALMHVLLEMCERVDGAARTPPRAQPKRPWWWWSLLPLTGTWWSIRLFWVSSVLTWRRKDSPTIYKGVLRGEKATAWTPTIPLETVRSAAKAADVKINDLLMSAVTGALRRYATTRGESLDGKGVRALIPVNLRAASATGELGNMFGMVSPRLPVDETDPRERLMQVKRRIDRLKRSAEPMSALLFVKTLGTIGRTAHHRLQTFLIDKGTLVVSNVPGPRKKLAFAGQPIEQIMFWPPPFGPTALSIGVFSYAGEVTVGVYADRAIVPDAEVLAAAFVEEIEELAALYPAALPAGET
jgi:hypothetical protein